MIWLRLIYSKLVLLPLFLASFNFFFSSSVFPLYNLSRKLGLIIKEVGITGSGKIHRPALLVPASATAPNLKLRQTPSLGQCHLAPVDLIFGSRTFRRTLPTLGLRPRAGNSPPSSPPPSSLALRPPGGAAPRAIYVLFQIERRCLLSTNRCLLYTSPSPRDKRQSRMPSSA